MQSRNGPGAAGLNRDPAPGRVALFPQGVRVGRSAVIKVDVQLDENSVPEQIHWTASDGPEKGRPAEAMMFSVWDPEQRNTLSIDLWTPRMTVDEMNFYVLQVLLKMAETYRKATSNPPTADLLDGFARQLTEQLEREAADRRKPPDV